LQFDAWVIRRRCAHAPIGWLAHVIGSCARRITLNLPLQAALCNEMIHQIFGSGRSANIAQTDK
jgi:hypothetical protein